MLEHLFCAARYIIAISVFCSRKAKDLVVPRLVRIIFPNRMHKSTLSRGIQHTNGAIANVTVSVLCESLNLLRICISLLVSTSQSVLPDCTLSSQRDILIKKLKYDARKHLPDVQIALAFYNKSMVKEWAEKLHVQKIGALALLRLWYTVLPEAFLENNISIEKIFPGSIIHEISAYQLEYLLVLNQGLHAHGDNREFDGTSMSISPCFTSILQLTSAKKSSIIQENSMKWVQSEMQRTLLFHGCRVDEAWAWTMAVPQCVLQCSFDVNESCYVIYNLNLLCRCGETKFLAEFISEGLKASIKRPDIYYELICQTVGHDEVLISPFFGCMFQKLCRLLKSNKKSDKEKKSALLYVLSSLALICIQSESSGSFLEVANNILLSEQNLIASANILSDASKQKKRKNDYNKEIYSESTWVPFLNDKNRRIFEAIWKLSGCRNRCPESGKSSKMILNETKNRISKPGGFNDLYCSAEYGLCLQDALTWTAEICAAALQIKNFLETIGSKEVKVHLNTTNINTVVVVNLLKHIFAEFHASAIPWDSMGNLLSFVNQALQDDSKASVDVCAALVGKGSIPFWNIILGRVRLGDGFFDHFKSLFVDLFHALSSRHEAHSGVINICLDRLDSSPLEDKTDYIALIQILQPFLKSSDLQRVDKFVNSIFSLKHEKLLNLETVFVSVCELAMILDWGEKSLVQRQGLREKTLSLADSVFSEDSNYCKAPYVDVLSRLVIEVYTKSGHPSRSFGPKTLIKRILRHLFRARNELSSLLLRKVAIHDLGTKYIVRGIHEAMQQAEGMQDKWSKREILAFNLPIVEGLLQLKSTNKSDIAKVFLKPLLNCLTSRPSSKSEAESYIELLNSYGTDVLNQLTEEKLSIDIEILDEVHPVLTTKAASEERYLHLEKVVPSMTQKAIALERMLSLSKIGGKAQSNFLCKSCLYLAKAIIRLHQLETSPEEGVLLGILGGTLSDQLAQLAFEDRQNPEFISLFKFISRDFLFSVLKSRAKEKESWFTSRRIIASLIPEPLENECNFSDEMEPLVSMHTWLASIFTKFVTNARVLDIIKNREACPLPISSGGHFIDLPINSVLSGSEVHGNAYECDGRQNEPNPSLIKKEICEIVETLIDMIDLVEEDMKTIPEEVEENRLSVSSAEQALLPYLLASYGASLSKTDLATWSLISAVNMRQWEQSHPDSVRSLGSDIQALTTGLIASKYDYHWGESILRKMNQSSLIVSFKSIVFEPARCVLCIRNFPEWRSLTGDGRLPDSHIDSNSAEHCAPFDSSAYDPSFILLMLLHCIQKKIVNFKDCVETGLLALCFRSLASSDIMIRAVSMEIISLVENRIDQSIGDGETEPQILGQDQRNVHHFRGTRQLR